MRYLIATLALALQACMGSPAFAQGPPAIAESSITMTQLLVGAAGGLIAAAWAFFRWLDSRFAAQRRLIDDLRMDCVRREEIGEIHTTLRGINSRVDQILLAMRGGRAAE
jgi:hypothetical protein